MKSLLLFYLSVVAVTTVVRSVSVVPPDLGGSKTRIAYQSEDVDTLNTTPYEDTIDTSTDLILGPEIPFTEDVNCDCGTSSFTSPFQDIINSWNQKKSRNLEKIKQLADPFIINGVRVNRGEIPWMVAITKYQHKKLPRWRVICGGAVLNQRYILTAAHCIHNRYKDTLEVVLNVDDATQISNDSQVIRRKIKNFIIHPNFNPVTIDSDIALIELKVPLDLDLFRSKIRPICLPEKDHKYYVNHYGTVSGWGFTKYDGPGGKGDNSPSLLKTTLPILSHEDCLKTKVPSKNNVTENMFCAGFPEDGGKADACINDSGGPLTVQDEDRSYIVGIVSWGIGCSLKDYPGVYTKVTNFLPWIKEKTLSGRWCNA